jgi:predicted membrane protein
MKKKKILQMPRWLNITLLVLGILFLLGGTSDATDMLVIGAVLTPLAIISAMRDGKVPKWLSITLLITGLVFLMGGVAGMVIATIFISISIIGFATNRDSGVESNSSRLQQTTKTINEQPKLIHNEKPAIQKSTKKHRSPLAITRDVLIVVVLLPIAIVIIGIFAVIGSIDSDKPNDQASQTSEQEKTAKVEKTVEDLNKIADELKAKVDKYAPIYCQNHTNVYMRNDKVLVEAGWPTFDGKRNWTQEECRTIISKLLDITTEDRISQISEGRKIGVGMTNVEVIYSLGYPDDINSTTNSYGVSEQWVYGSPIYDGQYVYLEDGVVTSYQQ